MRVARSTLIVFLGLLVTLMGISFPASAQVSPTDEEVARADKGEYYFVELEDKPVSTYEGGVKGFAATKVNEDEKLDVEKPAVKSYKGHLRNKQKKYKDWLGKKTKKAKIVSEYSLTLNGVAVKADGVNPDLLRQGPGVKRVVKSKKYYPAMNASHPIINTGPLYNAGYDGAGMKVGVIDSGIDHNHPFLKDPSLKMPKGYPKGDQRFTSNKVITARVFHADKTRTPEDFNSHGTHVAGTIAGVKGYKDPWNVAKTPLSGVAPKAWLGNYNVFPCEDCGAESIYIAEAIEAAVNDGMDVINMSLGGAAEPGFDLLVEVVNAASRAGVTMVISAGNEGPGLMTIGSPGIAEEAITVAAVSNRHFIGLSVDVTVDGTTKSLPVGSSDPGGKVDKPVQGPLAIVSDDDGMACGGISEDLTGKIAVIKRGNCTFTEKAEAAQNKGASGVILINNSAGDPTAMSVEEHITIPMVMVTMEDGAWISSGKSGSASMEAQSVREFMTSNDRMIASFSSRGPTVNFTLKPDVAAVGVNVYSSVIGGGLASYNGTSMSAPHVAGAAALLLQARPDWTPQQVKSALVGTGQSSKTGNTPLEIGGGIIDIAAALNPSALAYPSSLSFGKISSSSKKDVTIEVAVTNTSKKSQKFKVEADDKHVVKVKKKNLKIKGNGTETFTATISPKKKQKGAIYQGYITISSSTGKIRVPYFFYVE